MLIFKYFKTILSKERVEFEKFTREYYQAAYEEDYEFMSPDVTRYMEVSY